MSSSSGKHLISIVGPTAVGKTALAIDIAEFYGTDILSADSRQFYREMEIGTAKPSAEELARVKHHFVNSLSIHDSYDVGTFESEVMSCLSESFVDKDIMVMTGGSGLFCRAVWEGLDEFPPIPEGYREDLTTEFAEKGLEALQAELEQKDPVYFGQVDLQNPQRLIRAMEVIRFTGQPYSAFRSAKAKKRDFRNLKIGLELPRDELYERIERRMDLMIGEGLFDEAAELFGERHLNALQTVGYKEIFGFLEGSYDRNEAIRLLKRNSRRYAKRQLTWFKKDKEIHWFSPEDRGAIQDHIQRQLDT